MSAPMFHLTDDTIRTALTPAPEVRAPLGLAEEIRAAIEPVEQRHPGRLGWWPSRQTRLVLRVGLMVALLLLLVAALWLAGSTLNPAPPAIVSTYHGGPARTGIMPGPAPQGWPQLEEPVMSLSGPFGPWGPAVIDGLVLTGNQRGFVTATDLASHAQVWEVDLGAPINSGLSVAGDLAIVGDDAGIVHALHVRDGAPAWTWTAPSAEPIHTSAAVLGDVAIVGSLGGDLAALDVATGTVRWATTVEGEISRAIAAANGVAYVGVGGATPTDAGTLQAWDMASGTRRWSSPLQPGNTSTPTVAGGRVFLTGGLDSQVDAPHAVRAFDAATGAPAWPAPWTSDTGKNLYLDAVADGLVVVGSSDGELVALDAATGAVRWGPLAVGGTTSPNGGVVDHVLYAAVGGQRIMAVDLETGSPIWTIKVKGEPSAPTIVAGRILVDTTVGKLIWIAGGGPAPTPSPAASGG